jgi:acyl carrier protein
VEQDVSRDPQAVSRQLCDFLRAEILAEGIAFDEATPLAQLGVDSLSIVEMLVFIERRFGVGMPESALTHANLRSVSALARCVCDVARGAASEAERP